MFHLVHFNAEGRIPMKQEDDPFLIPNFPPIPPCDLPPSQHANNKIPKSHVFLRDESSMLWKSAGVLVNSVYELEAPAMEGLCQYLADASPNEVPFLILVALVLSYLMMRIGSSLRQKSLRRRTISFILHFYH